MANKITKIIIRAVRGILDISLLSMLLVGCQMQVSSDLASHTNAPEDWLTPPSEISENVHGVILPHHLLVESFMEEFYSQLAATNDYDRIVILSPNHFGVGNSYIQTTSSVDSEGIRLSSDWIDALVRVDILNVDNRDFGLEHGAFVQYPFIAKHFPDAHVLPIIIKRDTPCGLLNMLSEKLHRLDSLEGGKTLFLASLDFTHYTKESIAVLNDKRTIEWLEEVTKKKKKMCSSARTIAIGSNFIDDEAVAVDSPETLYVFSELMQVPDGAEFQLWARTSSIALIPTLIPTENTSHIFGYYSG